jgi:segregation and condensation protein B
VDTVEADDVAAPAEAEDVPVQAEAEDVPVQDKAEFVPVQAEAEDVPVQDEADFVSDQDQADVVPEEIDEIDEVDEGAPTLDLVDPDRLRAAVEAVLLVVDQPVDATTLAQTLTVPQPDVEVALTALRAEYDEGNRGIDLREVAGGWRLYSRDEFAGYVERFVLDGQQTRLTQAALETLAVIAYRQPVTRSRVSAVRGVGVDAVMRTLTTRGLVEECGMDAETQGGLYKTTPLFLEKLGLNSLEQLPPLAPLLPDHTDLDPAITDV